MLFSTDLRGSSPFQTQLAGFVLRPMYLWWRNARAIFRFCPTQRYHQRQEGDTEADIEWLSCSANRHEQLCDDCRDVADHQPHGNELNETRTCFPRSRSHLTPPAINPNLLWIFQIAREASGAVQNGWRCYSGWHVLAFESNRKNQNVKRRKFPTAGRQV